MQASRLHHELRATAALFDEFLLTAPRPRLHNDTAVRQESCRVAGIPDPRIVFFDDLEVRRFSCLGALREQQPPEQSHPPTNRDDYALGDFVGESGAGRPGRQPLATADVARNMESTGTGPRSEAGGAARLAAS